MPLNGSVAPLELVLADSTRVPVVSEMIIGRAPGSTLVLSAPSVSRRHARITADAVLEDAGSSHGTWLDGERVLEPAPLRDGALIRLGDAELRVERRREAAEAGRTIVVRAGASLLVPSTGPATSSGTQYGMRPRVRSGYALKRMDASEGRQRWVLKDLATGTFLRLSDNDAFVFELLDGTHDLVELVGLCEQHFGATGPARLARLLSDLGERGFLVGVAGAAAPAPLAVSGWRRWFKPREKVFPGVGPRIESLYRRAGWVLFTRPALIAMACLIVAGLASFVYLIVGRYGTPFVVASKLHWGGVVFLVGRFAVVAVHETAHGLTMASFGRRIERAGLKLVAIFPYAFVDTSEAWFEPRRRRIAVSAAGPVSDFSVGAVCAIACLVAHGTVRDVFFQLALAAYVGAFFNLNPFLDRDGYQILVDVLREPGLRRRSREQFNRVLSGGPRSEGDSRVLGRFAIAGVVWGVVAVGFVIAMSTRYYAVLEALAPKGLVWAALG